MFGYVDKYTNMPCNSAIMALLMCAAWLVYFYFANLNSETAVALKMFAFDPTELPIITIYPFYIPIFFKMFFDKELPAFKRFVIPALAIAGSLFMVVAAFVAHKSEIPGYLVIFAVIMAIGLGFMKKKNV
jgi:APA family basic amino acid/polyamine antiporter